MEDAKDDIGSQRDTKQFHHEHLAGHNHDHAVTEDLNTTHTQAHRQPSPRPEAPEHTAHQAHTEHPEHQGTTQRQHTQTETSQQERPGRCPLSGSVE